MCNLIEYIEKYEQENGKVTYSWKGQDEKQVNQLFVDWSCELKEELCKAEPDNKAIEEIIKKILKWGGIYRLKKERLKHYINAEMMWWVPISDKCTKMR